MLLDSASRPLRSTIMTLPTETGDVVLGWPFYYFHSDRILRHSPLCQGNSKKSWSSSSKPRPNMPARRRSWHYSRPPLSPVVKYLTTDSHVRGVGMEKDQQRIEHMTILSTPCVMASVRHTPSRTTKVSSLNSAWGHSTHGHGANAIMNIVASFPIQTTVLDRRNH